MRLHNQRKNYPNVTKRCLQKRTRVLQLVCIGILLICNLFLLWHSLEIRAHSIVTFFSILSLILFIKILENPSLLKYVFYFFTSIITLTLWPITLTIYFAKCIFIIKKYIQDKKFFWVLASNLIAIFIFYVALNYQYLFFNISRETHYTTIYETFFINYHFRSFFGSIFAGAVFLLVFFYFALRNVKEIIYKNNYSNIIIYTILSTYFLTLLYSTIRAPIMAPKYVIFILPLILIFVSHQVEINKFKRLTEPRARALLDMKPFVRYEKEYDAYLGFLLRYEADGLVNTGYDMYKMKSKKGTLYIVRGQDGDFTIFTQHFFDRYYQRVIDKSSKIPTEKFREKAIISFIKNIMLQYLTQSVGGTNFKGNQILLPYKEGFGLGIIQNGDIFVKTFIDNEQAKTNQLKTIEDFFKYSDNEFADYEPLKRKNK